MARLDEEAKSALRRPELGADLLIGAGIAAAGMRAEALDAKLVLLSDTLRRATSDAAATMRAEKEARELLDTGYPERMKPRRAMHWPLAYPEVFIRDRPGFDAIVGNPPFLGNTAWKGTLGATFSSIAESILGGKAGKIDLSVIFHRRAFALLRNAGCYGLLAANNLTESHAARVGLQAITAGGGEVYWGNKDVRWAGKASVVTAAICVHKGPYRGIRSLNGTPCSNINERLQADASGELKPHALDSSMFAFTGVHNGKGLAFVITPAHAWYERLKSERGSLLRPYATGDDITTSALRNVSRWALDLGDRDLEEIRGQYPIAYEFLTSVVKPTRTAVALKSYKGLIESLVAILEPSGVAVSEDSKAQAIHCILRVTKHPVCMLADSDWIYAERKSSLSSPQLRACSRFVIARPLSNGLSRTKVRSSALGRHCGSQ